MPLKTFFSVISALLGLIAFLPYIKEAASNKAIPHPFTWLIFSITQAAGGGITWQGGGEKAAILLLTGALLCLIIFLLSLKKGRKIITKSDIVILTIALVAISIWIFLEKPLLSIMIISGIDAFAYIPTFRKSYAQPHTEPISIWSLFILANSFAILSINDYNALTLTYLVTITFANILLVLFLVWRRYHFQ